MKTTSLLASQRTAKLWDNVFSIAMTTAAVRALV